MLLLTALLEGDGAARATIHWLLLPLLVARLLHPLGMTAPPGSPRQYACRGGGIVVTLVVLTVASILLLVRVM